MVLGAPGSLCSMILKSKSMVHGQGSLDFIHFFGGWGLCLFFSDFKVCFERGLEV